MIDPEQPTREPGEFYGRGNVLRRLFSRIGADRPQSVAVIGGSKTGKTSLLNHVAHAETRNAYLEDVDARRFLRLDCRTEGLQNVRAFVGELCAQLRGPAAAGAAARAAAGGAATGSAAAGAPATGEATAGGAASEPGSPACAEDPYPQLQRTVERLHGEGTRLVLLLDDFHLITGNAGFPLEFFSFLRSLANNYNLAYLTTSFLELQKLCVVKDIEESPFFNIFTNLSLGPLKPEESQAMLAKLTGGPADELGRVASWVGGYPYLLKRAARRLLEGKLALRDLDLEKALLPELAPYFQRILAILPPEAFGPLKDLARGRSPDPREGYLLRPLIKQGFLKEEGEAIVCFAPSLNAFLKRHLSKKMLAGGF
jgi:hypothetical protein